MAATGQTAPAPQAGAKEASKQGDKVVLKLNLPPPPFGALRAIPANTNADRSTLHQRRAPFYVPRGVTNVALHKPVTSSDNRPIIGLSSLVTDGDTGNFDGSWVTYAAGKQWVQIDLKRDYKLYAIVVWHYYGTLEARVYHDVVVQVSDDVNFLKNAHTVFNNDQNNELGMGAGLERDYFETYEGKLIDPKGVLGRYIRLYSKGNTTDNENNYIEVEAYGK